MRFRTVLKLVLLPAFIAVAAIVGVLSTMDFSTYRPLVAEKVKNATGREFEIGGDLRLSIGLAPAIVVEDVRLQNATFGTRAEMIKARRLEAEVALLPLLLGRVEIKRLALIGPDILLETDEQGRGNWDFSRDDEPATYARPATAEQAALDLPNLDAVTIENGLLTFRNGRTGKTTKIEVVRFDGRSASRRAPLEIDLVAAYDGVPFHVAGQLGAFVTLGSPGAFPVDLTADLADFQLAVKGTVNRPLAPTSSQLSIEATGNSFKGLSALFKAPLPAGPVAFFGQVSSENGTFTVGDITAKLGGSDLMGTARLQRNKDRVAVVATLTAHHFNLADFRAVEPPAENGNKAKAKPQSTADDGRLFSAEPLPLNFLAAFDGKLDAKIDRLVLGRATLDQATLSATLQDGQLSVEPLTATLAEGALAGAVALDTKANTTKLSLQVSKLDVNTFAQAFDAEDVLSGKVDVTTNLAGRGESIRALMASLEGKASVVMGKGQVKSSYVELLGADLLRFAASAGTTSDTTAVNCMVGRFDIAKGLATGRDILFDTSHMTVKGEGTVNLAAERLGLKFTPRPKDVSLLNLATPWRVEGTLDNPQVAPDETGIATRAAGALLSAINPLALLVPMISTGSGDKNPCVAALEPQQARAPAAKAKKESGGIRGLIDSVIPGR